LVSLSCKTGVYEDGARSKHFENGNRVKKNAATLQKIETIKCTNEKKTRVDTYVKPCDNKTKNSSKLIAKIKELQLTESSQFADHLFEDGEDVLGTRPNWPRLPPRGLPSTPHAVGSAGGGFAGACRCAPPSSKKRAGEVETRFGNWGTLTQAGPPAGCSALPTPWGARGTGSRVSYRPASPSSKNRVGERVPRSDNSATPDQTGPPAGPPRNPHAVGSAGGGFAGACRAASPSSKNRVGERVTRFGNSAILAQTGPKRASPHSPRRGERGKDSRVPAGPHLPVPKNRSVSA
jgi:hypothetical protein